MPVGSPRSAVTLSDLVDTCARLYARDGFVTWSEVAEIHGISRQAVHARLKAAVSRGDLPPETVEQWASVSSRVAASRERREKRDDTRRRTIQVLLTEENYEWITKECKIRKTKNFDIINGLINKARQI